MVTVLAFIAVFVVGAAFGMSVMALCVIGQRSDARFAETMRERMLEDDERGES
jgi:hypothetical protein